jgi:hypothetical protein
MAQCPHCQNALPAGEVSHCPNCGGDVGLAAVPAPPPVPPPPPAVPTPPRPPEPPSAAAAAPPEPPSAAPPGSPPTGGVPPGGGGRPPGDAGPGVPWEDRDRLGFGNALVETTKQVLGSPTAFFARLSPSGGLGAPLLYAIVIGWIGVVAASLYSALFQSIVGAGAGAFTENPELSAALGFAQGWFGFFMQVVLAPVGLAIGLFIAAGIFHVMLLILGGAREDFEATFRVVGYSQATAILMVVPFCGSFVAWVWSLVLYILGLAAVHRITGGKAAAAVLLPLLLLCCCCGLLAGLFASSLAALASQVR